MRNSLLAALLISAATAQAQVASPPGLETWIPYTADYYFFVVGGT